MDEYLDESLGPATLVTNLNKLGLDSLHSGQFDNAVQHLHRANFLVQQGNDAKLKAMTLNNLGCLYKRLEQHSKALKFLTEALEFQKQDGRDAVGTACTHLNICALRAYTGQHEVALIHAQRALALIKDLEFTSSLGTTVVVAYNNAANQHELLGEFTEASKLYYEGWQYAVENFGRQHDLATQMLTAFQQLTSKKRKATELPRPFLPVISDSPHQSKKLPKFLRKKPAEDLVTFFNEPKSWKPQRRVIQPSTPKSRARAQPALQQPSSVWTDSSQSQLSRTQRASSRISPVQYDNRIHFIGSRMKSLDQRIGNLQQSFLDHEERMSTADKMAFFSKRRQAAARSIQYWWRSLSLRVWLSRAKKAVRLLQQATRQLLASAQVKQHSCLLNRSVLPMQMSFRAWRVRVKVQKLRHVTWLQKTYRAWAARRFVRKQRNCRKIQSVYRATVARVHRTQWLNAVVVIETAIRKALAIDIVQHTFEVRSATAQAVQRLFRGFKGRNAFAHFEKKTQLAVLIVQTALRRALHTENTGTLKRTLTKAEGVIEKWYQGWKARRFYKHYRSNLHAQSLLIQQKFKQWLDKDAFEQLFGQRNAAALCIERYFRGHKGSQTFFAFRTKVNACSLLIQSVYRRFLARVFYETDLAAKTQGSLAIQTFYRQVTGRRTFGAYKALVDQNACIVQAWFKALLVREFSEQFKTSRTRASVTMQRIQRGRSVRNTMELYVQQLHESQNNIQKVFRAFCVVQAFKKIKYTHRAAALLIQKHFRRFRCQQEYLKKRASAIKIQSMYRGYMIRAQCEQLEHFLLGMPAPRHRPPTFEIHPVQELEHSSASSASLQAPRTPALAYEREQAVSSKKPTEFMLVDYHEECGGHDHICIRCFGDIVNKPPQNFSQQLSSDILQKELVMNELVRRVPDSSHSSQSSEFRHIRQIARTKRKMSDVLRKVIKAQAWVRGYLARLAYKREKYSRVLQRCVRRFLRFVRQKKRRAATRIQAHARSSAQRKSFRKVLGVLRIQTVFRMHQVRRQVRTVLMAVRIQKLLRSFTVRQEVQKILRAVRIQKLFRAFEARKQVSYLRSVVRMQSLYRGRVCRQQFKKLTSTIKLQAFVRGLCQRRRYKELRAARKIQKNVRAHFFKKQLKERQALLKLQALARGLKARKSYAVLRSSIRVQRVFRQFLAVEQYRKNLAALTIQRVFKSFAERRDQRRLRSAVRLQKAVRGFFMRRQYRPMRAIVRILSAWRTHVMQSECRLHLAARTVQTALRGFFARDEGVERKKILKVQAFARGLFIRKGYRRYRAARKIQSVFRGHFVRKGYKRFSAARKIQSHYRGHAVRNLYDEILWATIVLQKNAKCARTRRIYLEVKHAAFTIQRAWRAYKIRKRRASYRKPVFFSVRPWGK